MSAELQARRTAAAAALADFTRAAASHGQLPYDVHGLRLAIELRSLLEQLAAEKPDPAAAQLAQIRLVLDSFDWETDDRQYALEQIDDIMRSGQ
jgi:LPS sulfotransferase NodH